MVAVLVGNKSGEKVVFPENNPVVIVVTQTFPKFFRFLYAVIKEVSVNRRFVTADDSYDNFR